MRFVLVADDDPVQADVYTQSLAQRGFDCLQVADVAGALASVARRTPDAILLDLGLPSPGGVDLIRATRDLPQGRSIKIFALTNEFLELEAIAAWEAGADQVIGKANSGAQEVLDLLTNELGGPLTPSAVDTRGADRALTDFLVRATEHVRAARAALARAASGNDAPKAFGEIADAMRRLQTAQAVGLPSIPHLAAVTEWLARALVAWPSSVGPSSLRTTGQALDVIANRLGKKMTPGRDLTQARALGVDDDVTSRALVQQAFRKVRIPCDLFPDAAAALEAARSRSYDLVVSDVMMPGMDGFQFVRELRTIDGYGSTPVIYVTALDGFDRAFELDSHGGTDAIVKPYLIMELATKSVVHVLSVEE